MNAEQIIDGILAREGGFVDHPADKGGPTNRGITLGTLGLMRSKPVTVAELQALTEAEARGIYLHQYVEPFESYFKEPMLGLVVDMAVNHGHLNARRIIQGALKVSVDGIWGAQSLAAIKALPMEVLYRRAVAERVRFYGRIVTHDPSQAVFAAGWANRVAEFIERTP